MKTFEKYNDRMFVRFAGGDFRKALEIVKQLEKGKYNPKTKCWECPYTQSNRHLLVSNGFKDATMPIMKPPSPLVLPELKDVHLDASRLHPKLLPFQIRGIKIIEAHDGVFLLLDDQGVGKTWQAIGYCQQHPEFSKILVVVPAFLKINWSREIAKWGDEKVCLVSGETPYTLTDDFRYLIIGYNLLPMWMEELERFQWNVVIGDEAQYVVNDDNQRTPAFQHLARKSPHKLLLSGTLMRNNIAELFVGFNLISPINFSNKWYFLWRYCDPKHTGYGWDFSGMSNAEELRERLKPFYLRRMKSDVLPELPQKQRSVVFFDMGTSARKEYERASEKFEMWATSLNERSLNGEECYALMRQLAYAGKRNDVLEWIKEFLKCGRKAIIFAYHQAAIDDLQEILGKNCVVVTGKTSPEKRQKLVDKFQTDPKVQVFVGQVQAAGVGITLTAASDVIFVEFPYSPADVVQAEDRSLRYGQTSDKVAVWFLVAEHTVDEDMAALIQEKDKKQDAVFGEGKADPFFGKDIIQILAERIRSRHAK